MTGLQAQPRWTVENILDLNDKKFTVASQLARFAYWTWTCKDYY